MPYSRDAPRRISIKGNEVCMKKHCFFFGIFAMLLVLCLASCSSMQKITVKQEQEGQVQETVLESTIQVREVSMVVTKDSITYTGSWFNPSRRSKGHS